MKYEIKHFSNEHSENATGESIGINVLIQMSF